MPYIVGTAGHIDHGKSSLVRALTGIDPDRLKEEKARGITIELGFAHTTIGNTRVAFVDVPGHERFVRTMLAGVGGIDCVLLIVAALKLLPFADSELRQGRFHVNALRPVSRELSGLTIGYIAGVFFQATELTKVFTGRYLPSNWDPLHRVRGWKGIAAMIGREREQALAEQIGQGVFQAGFDSLKKAVAR